MSAAASTILTAFGLRAQELARALQVSNAVIFGGAALTWYLGEESPAGQDLDIACRPASAAMGDLIYALFDTLLRHAGYDSSHSSTSNTYTANPRAQIEIVYTWHNRTLNRAVQLVVRKPGAPSVAPTDASDLDVARITVVPRHGTFMTVLPPELSASQIDARRMRFHDLAGQQYRNLRRRILKYYRRGFMLEDPTTGRALRGEQALEMADTYWAIANPLPDTDLRRADVLLTHLHRFFEGVTDPLTKHVHTIDAQLLLCSAALRNDLNRVLYESALAEIRVYSVLLKGIADAHRILEVTTQEEYAEIRRYGLFEDFYTNLSVNGRFPEVTTRVRAMEERLRALPIGGELPREPEE